ncbi:hypothetical protein [Streptomyces sp. WMMB303]|uniref:hypothetical protein n=1 Tax=Streptomyces sp. WMMB303 TaxID=3034154 RepID=UPI0023ED04D3|nr:hypothetical protein [Streptomyces sp. WMMB303]MDF4254687.1 hypothetical protein [Streptomyces sp. WMMB303]
MSVQSPEASSAPQSCGCNGGQVMATVNRCGADGEPYQSLEMQNCPSCNGSGQR